MASNSTMAPAAFRLSAQQERSWQQIRKGIPASAQLCVRIRGACDGAKLARSISSVVSNYEILRTVLRRQSGVRLPFQVILNEPRFVFRRTAFETADFERALQSERENARGGEQDSGFRVLLLEVSGAEHLLVLTLPGFLGDTATLMNIAREIGLRYSGHTNHDEVMQYADLVEWQNEMLASDETKTGRKFWIDTCRAIDFPSLEKVVLPLETTEAASFSPEVLSLAAPERLSSDLRKSAASTLAQDNALLSAWVMLLSRLTGETTIILGCEFDGRRYEELASAFGPLVRNFPLGFSLDAQATFRSAAAKAGSLIEEARNWQEAFSWAQLVDGESPDLPLSFSSVDLGEREQFGELSFEPERLHVLAERFKLRLVVVRRGPRVGLEFHYDAARLDRGLVERIAGWYQNLLRAGLANAEAKVCELPLLSEAERQQLVVEWNNTGAEYPAAKCLHQLFEVQAERTPERVAVRCGERAFTYQQLNARANQLGHYLRRQGVGPDKLVGVCLERSAETMVAVLAILKAGGAYVPLNPDNPPARMRQQMEGAVVVLTESKLSPQVPEFAGAKLVLDAEPKPWSGEPTSNPSCTTTPENLVYVLYTSGSTGVPKGVAVRHRNLVNYADFIGKRLEAAKHSAGLQFATVSTLGADLGNTCIYPSLISGGTLHVIGYETATDGVRFAEYAAKYGIDVLKIVPSHMAALLQTQSDAEQAKKLLPRKYLVFGGETLTAKLLEKIEALAPSCEVLNHYGPTETTVGSLTLTLKGYGWKSQQLSSIPIGRPIQNTQVYVLDQNLQPVPVGVRGELYIAGAGVTAGYLNQAEKTAERFLKNPYSSDGGAKMYRTGDLARYLEGGEIEFLGRSDDQVKVRGFRIELGEIEAALARHQGVKQALVLARENEQGDKRLLGYAVAQGSNVTGEQLRDYLKQEVPDYMVPQAIAVLAKFPLTPNGKIDRQALPEPQAAAQRAYIAPRNKTEQKIAEIWAEVLRRDLPSISTEDNFFDLGGHSLMATQVVSRIRRGLSVELPLRTLFEHATISALAREAQKIEGVERGEVLALKRVSRKEPLPLSFAQQRLWVLDRIEPNNPLYNIPRAFQLKGSLDIPSLTGALNEIVRRHESLRTTFASGNNGEPVQVISESFQLDVPVINLTEVAEQERESSAREFAIREEQTPFDLSTGPLVRAKILKLGANEHVLLLTTHHIVSDAWSASIFFQELEALYEAFTQGRPSPLPELALQYADYAAWQRAYLQGRLLEQQLDYWREHLKGAPRLLELPADRTRPEVRTFLGAHEPIPLAADVALAAKEFSQKEGATLFMVLFAAYNALLSRYSGEQHIVLGTDIANRTTPETERMIGFFINLLPLHTDLSGDPTFRELVSRVREAALGAYAHQDIPFDKLVEDLRPERSLSHNPIVQALFVMQNTPPQRRELAEVQMRGLPVPITRSKFDVAVFVRESPGGAFQDWVYSTELFDRGTIIRMATGFETILRSALFHPERRISELQIHSAQEKQQLETEKKERKHAQRKKLGTAQPRSIQLGGSESQKQ
jgi:amino acid adenylation domain-containing protein